MNPPNYLTILRGYPPEPLRVSRPSVRGWCRPTCRTTRCRGRSRGTRPGWGSPNGVPAPAGSAAGRRTAPDQPHVGREFMDAEGSPVQGDCGDQTQVAGRSADRAVDGDGALWQFVKAAARTHIPHRTVNAPTQRSRQPPHGQSFPPSPIWDPQWRDQRWLTHTTSPLGCSGG